MVIYFLFVRHAERKQVRKDVIIQHRTVGSGVDLMHEWLSGGVSPCQGEGRGFESRLVLFLFLAEAHC